MKQQTNRNRRWVWPRVPTARRRWITSASKKMTSRHPVKGRCYCEPFLSLDPYMRGRMSDEPSYAPPVEPGCVMVGGTVSRVVASNHPDYRPDEWVLSYNGWQDYDISDGEGLVKLGDNPQHPSGRWEF